MLKKVIVSIVFSLFLACVVVAQNKNPLEKRVDDVIGLFSKTPDKYEEVFDKEFLKQVPATKLTELFTNFFDQLGSCIKTTRLASNQPGVDKFELIFEKGFSVQMTIIVDTKEPYYVTSLFLSNPTPIATDFNALTQELKKFPGETSFVAAKLKDGKLQVLASHNPDTPLAIGSTFKLYVLSELVRSIKAGEHKWNEVTYLQEDAMSLPSGMLQKWPVDSPVTLYTLASLMISISDNTATDHLIKFLGREKIEKILSTAGNTKTELNIPFLKTSEMFKLKLETSSKMADIYIAKDAKARRDMLNNEVSKIDKQNLKAFSKPLYVDKIEWFASANDLARLLNYLREQTESEETKAARGVLAINSGIEISKKDWAYIGFKGGSEPGVVNLTYLLQSTKGEWFFLSLGWNNTNALVDENKLIEITKSSLDLLRKTQ